MNNKKVIAPLVIMLIILGIGYVVWSKCLGVDSRENQKSNTITSVQNNMKIVQENRQRAIGSAAEFRKGRELMDKSLYENAIHHLEVSYNIAGSRISQGMALEQMAICYEKLGQYERAINFYDETSKATMNPSHAEQLQAKITELRKLISNSQH